MQHIGVLACAITLLGGPVLAQRPPRDPPLIDRELAAVEAAQQAAAKLEARIAAAPHNVALRIELAKLQEEWGRYDESEATLIAARTAAKSSVSVLLALTAFYNRSGNFEKTMESLEAAADLEPWNPESYHRIAVFYWEKAFRDRRLTRTQKRTYLDAGIASDDQALALDGNYAEALIYKNIMLRMLANETEDAAEQRRLVEEADRLRARAMEMHRLRSTPIIR